MNWAIIPAINLAEMTIQAAQDCLAQTLPTRVLIISNGSDDADRATFEKFAAENHPRVLLWSHDPALPTLSATWNRALDFVWETGAEHCLVPNNDVRLHKETYARLLTELQLTTNPLFVSAVNAGDLFDINQPEFDYYEQVGAEHGGPDFSCFLISRLCHGMYRFDDNLSYCNDLDLHRRMMIGGDGARIYSINARYLHFASQTIKRATPEAQERFLKIADQHRAYYAQKWGGPVNQETRLIPWQDSPALHATTPELQKHGCDGRCNRGKFEIIAEIEERIE